MLGRTPQEKATGTNMSDAGIPDLTDPEDVRRFDALYLKFGYQPALQMLGQIASIDVSRTKGRSGGQAAAAKLQKKFLNAIKVDKSGIQ
jgi:hypothetical protein